MSGRQTGWLLLAVIVVGLLWQLERGIRLWRADRVVGSATRISSVLVEQGNASAAAVSRNIDMLHVAERLDPVSVSIPLLLGAQYLLRGRAEPAIEALERAEALEPRAEVYRNLGEAYRLLGDDQEALRAYARAKRLDPALADAELTGFMRAQRILRKQGSQPTGEQVLLFVDFENGSVKKPLRTIVRDGKKRKKRNR
ncbi:MAG: tetratricopeptide repeat protein [Acidobacteriota bacterium]